MKHGTAPVPEERLRLARSPAAELAAAAIAARDAAGLAPQDTDYVVVAIEAGQSDTAELAARRALEQADPR